MVEMKRLLCTLLTLSLVLSCCLAATAQSVNFGKDVVQLKNTDTAPAVNTLWSSCDDGTNWDTEATRCSLSLNKTDPAVGKGCIQVDGVAEMWFFSISPAGPIDCTYVTHLDFWFYTSNVNIFKNATDCAFDLSYTGAWSSGGVRVSALTLKSLTLQEGWNHLTLPLDFSYQTPDCDLTKIGRFRFYSVGLNDMSFEARLDEVRFVNQAGLENADLVLANQVTERINQIGTVTTYSGPAIEEARKAYSELTDLCKSLVENYQTLVDAEAAFATLKNEGTVVFPADILNKPVQSTDDESWLISACDTADPLTVEGATNVNVATAGDDSFTVLVGKGGSEPIQLVSTNQNSITGYYRDELAVKFQLYVSDVAALDTTGQLEITSSGGADQEEYYWRLSQMDLKNGWNNVYLTFRSALNTGGAADLAAINYMRIYAFLSKSVVVAVNDIRIVKEMKPELNEHFFYESALEKWTANGATLTFEEEAMKVEGENQFSFETSAYPLHILQPSRTPLEFELSASAVPENLTVQMTDFQGKTAYQELNVTKLADGKTAYFTVVPSDMTAQDGFSFETVETVTFSVVAKGKITLLFDEVTTTLREGKYWRDWVYHYQAQPGDYSLAVIPDIQELTVNHSQKLNTIYQWITANKKAENIQFAVQVGDVTWNGHAGSSSEFRTAAKAFKLLQAAGIDYSISYGNHDVQTGRNTYLFNQAFPYSTLSQFPSFGGTMEEEKVDNLYNLFEVQGNKYMVLTLELEPRPETVAWANEVVAAHPDRQVIVVTHDYLGSVYGERSATGESLWNNLISKHGNIVMVLCGHDNLPDDPGSLNYKTSQGEKGNTVHQIMANAQDIDADRDGVGLLLMLRFTNNGKTATLNYFSPVNSNLAYKEQNQFSIELDTRFVEESPVEPPVETPTDAVPYGDVNGDETVNAKDALEVLKITVGKVVPTDPQKAAADADGDGTVGAKDALEILKFTVGKPSALDKHYKKTDQ